MPQGPHSNSVDAMLFDVDGTLIDSLGVIVSGLGDTVDHFCGYRPAREVLLSGIGIPLIKHMMLYAGDSVDPQQLEQMCAYAVERFEALSHEEIAFDAAVEALIACHEAGVKTALVTSKSGIELDAFLSRFHATFAVDVAVCASDVLHPKPAPESAILACQRLGVDPARAVMIGDSLFDLRCARDAGLRSIAVTYGAAPRASLLAEQPDLFFDTPEDLLAWVRTTVSPSTCPARS